MQSKLRKLVSFNKLESSLKQLLIQEYPNGFGDAVIKVDAPKPFYAVLFECEETTYLVKLNKYLVNASLVELEDEDKIEPLDLMDIDEEE
ncbi:MAG: hypothetical protein ACI837_000501 [Crocinitomicaceae bacterium]|jgi:hypothetical protein